MFSWIYTPCPVSCASKAVTLLVLLPGQDARREAAWCALEGIGVSRQPMPVQGQKWMCKRVHFGI